MADEIRVRIIPGCPGIIVAEDEESKELAKATLANNTCGCLVKTEAEVAEALSEEAEEAEEPTSELTEEEVDELAEVVVDKVKEGLVCSLEPDKPWDQSVCGVVAEEAGRLAADRVMVRLREEGLVT